MRKSVTRYLIEGGVLALLVNVAINWGVGSAIYGGLAEVTFAGDKGILGDTLVGAFLIGFFTMLIVAPQTRREVRAGHIVGGWRGRVPRRQGLVAAIAVGAISLVVVGVPTVAIAKGFAPMSATTFLWFKVGFAAVWGTLSAVLIAAVAIAGEPEPPDDDRWSRDGSTPAVSYPCDYVDKGGLAVTSKAHGRSGTPTWQLVVKGTLDPAAVRAALGDILVRYPPMATRVQSLDAIPEYAKRFRYVGMDVDLDMVFRVVEGGDLDALIQTEWDRPLDQFREPPFSLVMAITEGGSRLLFRQHHGIADGRAFIELLADFALFIGIRERGETPTAEQLAPIARRSELDALELPKGTQIRYAIAGFGSLTASILGAIVRPHGFLVPNESSDYTGANGAVRWVIDDKAVEAWNVARKDIGASVTSLMTAALFTANHRWHRELGKKLGRVSASLVMETRPRGGTFRSFANHLATLEAVLPLDRDIDRVDAARSIHAQIKHQLETKRPIKRLLIERALIAGIPLDKLHAIVFDAKRPAFNMNFSNLIPLDFPTLRGTTWTVDEVLITTPVTPRNGIVLTVIRYNGRVCFNFNYVATAATREQTEHLAKLFREELEALTKYRAEDAPTCSG